VCPNSLLPMFGIESFWEALRTLRIRALPLLPSLRTSVRKSSAVLATNSETQAVLRRAGASGVRLLMDSALPGHYIPQPMRRRTATKTLNLIWANRLVRWKGLDLAILALQQLGPGSGVRLVVAGGGPLQSEFSEKVQQLDLENMIVIRGKIPWDDMVAEFESADALLLTSTRESLGSVVLEAAAYALPFITLKLGGAATFFPASAGIKIAPTTVRETARGIAKAIVELRDYPERRLEMGRCAYGFAKASTWDLHARIMQQVYDEAAVSGSPLRIARLVEAQRQRL